MDTSKLVQWLMECPLNWVGYNDFIVGQLYLDQNGGGAFKPVADTLAQIRNQPPLPLGEWFTPETKHAYCTDCGEWVAVEDDGYLNFKCVECGYCIATYAGENKWGADGDIADEYVWVASKHRYEHVDNYRTTFDFAHDVNELPANSLALKTLMAVDTWLATQPQEVFESMGTGVAYAVQKAIQGMATHDSQAHPAQSTTGYIASMGGWD